MTEKDYVVKPISVCYSEASRLNTQRKINRCVGRSPGTSQAGLKVRLQGEEKRNRRESRFILGDG